MIIIIIFQPIAVETLGPINESAREFLDDLSRRIYVSSGDDREHLFLSRRISVAVQRFNAVLGLLFALMTTRTIHSKPLYISLIFWIFPTFVFTRVLRAIKTWVFKCCHKYKKTITHLLIIFDYTDLYLPLASCRRVYCPKSVKSASLPLATPRCWLYYYHYLNSFQSFVVDSFCSRTTFHPLVIQAITVLLCVLFLIIVFYIL